MGILVKDSKTQDGKWLHGFSQLGVRYDTLSYTKWQSMLQRCKEYSSMQERCKTYVGCTLSDSFKDFQVFTAWHTEQVGYDMGLHLDKDLLVSGNKHYSEETCVLIPRQLNNFLTSSLSVRGKYPQGIYLLKRDNVFQVMISIDGKKKYIGRFLSEDGAVMAYKEAKEAEAYRWYERLRDGEFTVDPRVIERMRTWTLSTN